MPRYLFRLEFDGAPLCGWQKQAEDREAADRASLQSVVEDGLRTWLRLETRAPVQGCGRTDAGVHAEEFFAHVDLPETLSEERLEKLRHGLNSLWPEGVCATGAWAVGADVHALDSIDHKTYEYRVLLRRSRPVLLRGRCLWLPVQPGRDDLLDPRLLEAGLRQIEGEHDFIAFAASGATTSTSVRRVLRAELLREPLGGDPGRGELWRLRFTGEGFLKQMVRNLVGTLLEVGQRRRPPDDIARLLAAAAPRTEAGFCAPPEALFLTQVSYPARIRALWKASEFPGGSGG